MVGVMANKCISIFLPPQSQGWRLDSLHSLGDFCSAKLISICMRVWFKINGSGILLATEENPGVLEFSQKWFGFQGGSHYGWPGSLPACTAHLL